MTSERKRGFAPRKGRAAAVAGTRQSLLYPQQLLTSTGIPSLDDRIGGGLPIGTLVLVEQDHDAVYSSYALRAFLAEGVTCGHEVFLASLDDDPSELLHNLPSPVLEEQNDGSQPATNGNCNDAANAAKEVHKMQIAWRYANKKGVVNDHVSKKLIIGHNFNVKTKILPELLEQCTKFVFGRQERLLLHENIYQRLFVSLKNVLVARQLKQSANSEQKRTKPTIMRVAIHAMGSPAWHASERELVTHFTLLHALLRDACCVGMITVPSRLLTATTLQRIRQYASFVVRLASFKNSSGATPDVDESYRKFQGVLDIKRIAPVNSLVLQLWESKDLVFKLKREVFVIETFHLPPDLSETVSRSVAGCGAVLRPHGVGGDPLRREESGDVGKVKVEKGRGHSSRSNGGGKKAGVGNGADGCCGGSSSGVDATGNGGGCCGGSSTGGNANDSGGDANGTGGGCCGGDGGIGGLMISTPGHEGLSSDEQPLDF